MEIKRAFILSDRILLVAIITKKSLGHYSVELVYNLFERSRDSPSPRCDKEGKTGGRREGAAARVSPSQR
jgi:hypothetical protein